MISSGPTSHIRNNSLGAGNNYSSSGSVVSSDSPRHMSSGSLSIPTARPQNGTQANGQPQNMPPLGAVPRFDGPRSPPAKQNTAHVPCKFFRQGACQAGKACPFSHDLASTSDSVCKYFAKGNCKFGPKCANVHVLPDGRRVNYGKNGVIGVSGGPLNIGGRINPDPYHSQSSALTNGFLRANMTSPSYGPSYPPTQFPNDDSFPPLAGRPPAIDIARPSIDTTSYTAHPGSNYGSPRDEEAQNRFGLGLSPVSARGMSVLDAPLPSSFDSNGISNIAIHGKIAASVPTKFGFDSPVHSLGSARDGRTSEALKNLHTSAFGEDARERFNGAPASPPSAVGEEYFGKRPLHSQRVVKPRIMSSSLPKSALNMDRDWDDSFPFEEDYLPDNLKELLTPQEKARRGSRAAEDEGRPIYSGVGTPNDSSSKFGSPSNASPSRWGPLFERRREEEEKGARGSLFGHVGSPLRNSALNQGTSPSTRGFTRPATGTGSGDASPFLASPPRQSSMSILSQQLQRTRLSQTESSIADTSAARSSSNPITAAITKAELERQVSSSSSFGRFTTPIDEEGGEFVFSMEEEEEKDSKRNSGNGWNYSSANASNGSLEKTTSGDSAKTIDGMFGMTR